MLRKLYPKHSLVMSQDYNFNVFGFPGAVTMPLKPDELITNTMFIPLARSMGASGILTNSIEFGAFTTAWDVSGLLSSRHHECRLISALSIEI